MSASQQLLLGEGAGGSSVPAIYIEDVFSTYLYTGTGASQTITNNIDMSTKGGLTWIKSRSAATGHRLTDTARGATKSLASDTTAAEVTESTGLTAFGTTGFTIGADADYNTSADTYASWSFREQAKFFDIVTYTGTGSATTIAHSLGTVPGCIIVKCTSVDNGNWRVYHRSLTSAAYVLSLNAASAESSQPSMWNSTAPTSTVFTVGTDIGVNDAGQTYVAYLFAHDAGGFGLSGTDNVISCGSFVGASATVTLGYEPQWILTKNITSAGADWRIADVMRGMSVGTGLVALNPNTTAAESTYTGKLSPTATGFDAESWNAGNSYIYIAIRRGPMKVPTAATSVFGLNARTGTGTDATVTGSAGVSDTVLIKNRGSAVGDLFASRLTGTNYLETSSTAAQVAAGTTILQANPWDVMDGVKVGTTSTITNASASTFINYLFDRAPGFFDVVCYTGTGVVRTVTHNLAAVPTLMIVKSRTAVAGWVAYSEAIGATKYMYLNRSTGAATYAASWNNTAPTASVFTVGTDSETNGSARLFVAYLFATCAGVSKVGSYTGNGASQTIACGFSAGSRFVMIKRTDASGDWYVWDSARGIVAGNDPHLSLNSTAAEVTTDDSVDTDSGGFIVNQVAATNVNVTSATYIFLAIA